MRRMTKDGYYLNRHSCFLLQYHMVLVTMYRNPVLTGSIKEHVYTTIQKTLEEKEIRIIEMNGEPDNIHILFECGPEISPLTLANVLKTRSARFVRRDLPEEARKFYPSHKPMFWSKSYFICTVGSNNKDIVENYIRNQGSK
jgi:putative transposase